MKQIITLIKKNEKAVKPKVEDINYNDTNYIIENTMNNIVKTRYLINDSLNDFNMLEKWNIKKYLLCYNKVFKQHEETKNSKVMKFKRLSLLYDI